MIDNSDILIKEVDDAVRNEKMQRFILLFGRYIVVLSLLILLATIGYVWWGNQHLKQNQEVSAKLFAAIELTEAGKSREAKPIFDEVAKQNNKDFAVLAGMWQVKLKYLSEKQDEAKQIAEINAKKITKDFSMKSYHDWFQLIADYKKDNKTYQMNRLELIAAEHLIILENPKVNEALSQLLAVQNIIPTIKERAGYISQMAYDGS
jgi:hypothetical protein